MLKMVSMNYTKPEQITYSSNIQLKREQRLNIGQGYTIKLLEALKDSLG